MSSEIRTKRELLDVSDIESDSDYSAGKYEFRIKKKIFGGLDPDSVTEYITGMKAENNHLKKKLAAKDEGVAPQKVEKLKNEIDELNSNIESYKKQIDELNGRIESLENDLANAKNVAPASNSKIAAESLNIANHYFSQAVKMTTELSDSTIAGADKSKSTLEGSLETIEDFEKSIAVVKEQIKDIMSSFDEVSGDFEKLKSYEDKQISPVSSGDLTDEKAKLSLVD